MNKNQCTDKKLQIEILKFINSFPCEYPRSEPTTKTIYDYFCKDRRTNTKIFNHNFNKLRNKYIESHGISSAGEIFSLTTVGEAIINPKNKIFRNKNTTNKTTIKNISIIGNNNIVNQGNNSIVSTNKIFLKELKKIINKSNLTKKQQNTWFNNFKNYCSNPKLFIDILKLGLKYFIPN